MNTGRRVLVYVLEAKQRGVTSVDCAKALSLTYAVARWHLWKLSREGWIAGYYEPEDATGKRGGPCKRWRKA